MSVFVASVRKLAVLTAPGAKKVNFNVSLKSAAAAPMSVG